MFHYGLQMIHTHNSAHWRDWWFDIIIELNIIFNKKLSLIQIKRQKSGYLFCLFYIGPGRLFNVQQMTLLKLNFLRLKIEKFKQLNGS